ncbi:hypothetical protein F4778DRAFT_469545 [Xylariomycetidae sp. FL2044]|nr:hypothetical protein F4778DRAFT_469545 [Xylariomycetidae sp. FL2044]
MTSLYSEVSQDDSDFETPISTTSRRYGYPSPHSGFGFSDGGHDPNDESDDNMDNESLSQGNYSPPAWRRLQNGERSYGHWRATPDLQRHRSEFEQARRTRLPTGSLSPENSPKNSPEPEAHGEDDTVVKMKSESGSVFKREVGREIAEKRSEDIMASVTPEAARNNYIRFALRADIQQRTEPIETAVNFLRSKSWGSVVVSLIVALVAVVALRTLFLPASMQPAPDLVKVAGVARSFEPMIYFSENSVAHVGNLQATGVAVWDLGESLRLSNMTSAPIIVKSLDDLSDNLKTLAMELTKFFANVDGDIDGILIVMDWARQELIQVHSLPSGTLSTLFDNLQNLACRVGLLENERGEPTRLGAMMTTMFGMSQPQRARSTLQRTFTEFLSVLEEAIENEVQQSLALFALFEAIDRQFLNLARTVAREASLQDEAHADLLSSLWTRILGPKASEVNKYERNRDLLQNVREKTVYNKGILVEHNNRLLSLKANLESLRRKLVSPLVRSQNSSTLTLEAQIRGLEQVGGYLEDVRKRQKGRLLETLYGGKRGTTATARLIGEGGGDW